MSVFLLNETGNDVEVESSADGSSVQTRSEPIMLSDASRLLAQFWPKVTEEVRKIDQMEVRLQALPLARIKKIMKLDEDVKMISAEAPVLFAKAAELFIEELTLRAWVHTEDNKRRTLQRNDIAMAITKYDQFDFLIDIVPRDEVKPAQRTQAQGSSSEAPRAAINADQVHYYFQLAQQHQAALSTSGGATTGAGGGSSRPGSSGSSPSHSQTGQVTAAVVQHHHQEQQQQQQIKAQPQPTTGGGGQSSGGGIQLVQQVVMPAGEIQHVPIQLTASQMAMIKMQLQNNSGQPIIIQTAPVQPQPQIIQVAQASAGGTPLFVQSAGSSAVAAESD